MKTTIRLFSPQQGHQAMQQVWVTIKPYLMAGHVLEVVVRPETRSTAQNARMWAMLTDVAEQVVWHGRKLTPEAWKHVFSASLKKQDVVPGIDGGFVVLGLSTSQMTKAELSDLMELIAAFGAGQGVEFHDEAIA